MKKKQIEVKNKLGLHARAASKLVEVTNRFSCDIQIRRHLDQDTVNGKSIMSVMLLAAPIGSELEFLVEGEDEDDALIAIEAIFDDYFGEGG